MAPLLARWRKDMRELANNLDAVAIKIAATALTATRIQTLLESKLPIFAYTVNTPSKANKLQQLGLKGIFTDRPDKLEKYLLS